MKQISVFLLIVFIIFLRYFFEKPKFKNGQKIRITEKVLQEPSRFSNSQRFYLKNLKIYLPKYPQINYGDWVIVEGIVDNGKLTNAVLINYKENENILYVFRKKILEFFKKNLSEPYFSLVSGVVLGYKSNVSEEFNSLLQKTGTMHVVVASGMNVTFVGGFLLSIFLLFMPRRKAIPFVLAGIWIYTVIAGAEAPIIRASIMTTIALIAQEAGKLNRAFRSLIISALVMLLIKPIWINDLGFILSFVATASLIIFNKKIESALSFVPKFIRGDLATTLAAQVGVTPILFVTFSQFNILSPLINALVLWTVPIIMILGSIAALIGLIFPLVGKGILFLLYPLCFYFVNILKLLS